MSLMSWLSACTQLFLQNTVLPQLDGPAMY